MIEFFDFFFNDTATTEIYPYLHTFPYTTLFRSLDDLRPLLQRHSFFDHPEPHLHARRPDRPAREQRRHFRAADRMGPHDRGGPQRGVLLRDRKSTRLNSSH